MSRPIKKRSHDAATATGPGAKTRTKGHKVVGIFVSAPNVEPSVDTVNVEIEVSPDGEHWASVNEGGGDRGSVSTVDFNESGNAYVVVDGIAADYARSRITEYNDAAGGDLEVDAWLMATGWTGSGNAFEFIG